MRYRAFLPNALSLSRVPLALAFVLTFNTTHLGSYFASVAIAIAAWVSDVLDGSLAKHWAVQTQAGRFLDGLGDKAFYLALLLVMLRTNDATLLLVWLLAAREIFLYALRSVDPLQIENTDRFRILSWTYALCIRTWFALFLTHYFLVLTVHTGLPFFRFAIAFGYAAAIVGGYHLFSLIRVIAERS